MNEQLIVKNFGPIKDAKVDFKRVTVFIGPTGGGKSTLAKLAAVFRDRDFLFGLQSNAQQKYFDHLISNYEMAGFSGNSTCLDWQSKTINYNVDKTAFLVDFGLATKLNKELSSALESALPTIASRAEIDINNPLNSSTFIEELESHIHWDDKPNLARVIGKFFSIPLYIPAERSFASIVEGAGFSLRRAKAVIPFTLENFLSFFESARRNQSGFFLPLFDVSYHYIGNKSVLKIGENIIINLTQGASGIQTTVPLMLVVEDLYSYIDSYSFIIEEPELNLYPTAQQGLLSWLVEKCTKGENDLTITTHSPYLLAHFNTLLFAHQVAQNHPERADEIAKIVPRESWLDPKEFVAYHVEGQQENGVRSIINPETGLISYNGLDAIASAEASEFEKLLDINAGLEVEW